MIRKAIILHAAPFFEHYPKVDTFYVTEDGQVFEQKNNAQNHANSFKESLRTVYTVARQEAESVENENPPLQEVEIDTSVNEKGTSDNDKAPGQTGQSEMNNPLAPDNANGSSVDVPGTEEAEKLAAVPSTENPEKVEATDTLIPSDSVTNDVPVAAPESTSTTEDKKAAKKTTK